MALSSTDLREVRSFLLEVQLQWYDFGIELGVKKLKLDIIKQKFYNDSSDCLREMITEWLKHGNPTWEAIEIVLRSDIIDNEKLAEKGTAEKEYRFTVQQNTVQRYKG